MKNYLFLLIFIGFVASLPAQKGDRRFAARYAEAFSPGEKEIRGAYQWVITKTADGRYIRRTYFPETRQLISIAEYSDKKLRKQNGMYRGWTDDGRPRVVSNYRDGRLHGAHFSYHADGSVKDQGAYLHGKKDGNWTTRYESGAPRKEETYREGSLEGEVIYYDSLGAVAGTVLYRNDEPAAHTWTTPRNEKAARIARY